jgi:adenylate kinase
VARARRLPKISTGEILREAVHDGTDLGRIAKETIEAGNLVPDAVMIGIVGERINREDARRGFVLDGFPRTVVQATELDRMMDGRGVLIVLDMVVPEDVLVRRLASRRICGTCGANAEPQWRTHCEQPGCGGTLVTRADDGTEIVRERLKVYHRETQPLVEYYSRRPAFRSVDGNQPADVVTAAVDAAIEGAIKSATL